MLVMLKNRCVLLLPILNVVIAQDGQVKINAFLKPLMYICSLFQIRTWQYFLKTKIDFEATLAGF